MRLVCLLFIALFFTSTAAAQDAPEIRFEKDPALATVLSVVVTGAGQIYTGKTTKGVTLLAIGAGAPAAGFLLRTRCPENRATCFGGKDYTPVFAGVLLSVGAWLAGVTTASTDARQYNTRVAPSMMAGRPGVSLRVSL